VLGNSLNWRCTSLLREQSQLALHMRVGSARNQFSTSSFELRTRMKGGKSVLAVSGSKQQGLSGQGSHLYKFQQRNNQTPSVLHAKTSCDKDMSFTKLAYPLHKGKATSAIMAIKIPLVSYTQRKTSCDKDMSFTNLVYLLNLHNGKATSAITAIKIAVIQNAFIHGRRSRPSCLQSHITELERTPFVSRSCLRPTCH